MATEDKDLFFTRKEVCFMLVSPNLSQLFESQDALSRVFNAPLCWNDSCRRNFNGIWRV